MLLKHPCGTINMNGIGRKREMKRTLIITALVVAVTATAAWSQGGGTPRGMGGAGMSCPAMATALPQASAVERVTDTLGLTDEQVTKLTAAMTKSQESINSLAQTAATATKALGAALVASEYDAQKVKELAAAAEKAEAAVVSARIDEWTQIRSILTADQAKQFLASAMQRPPQGQRPPGPPPGDGGFPPAGTDGPPPPPPDSGQ